MTEPLPWTLEELLPHEHPMILIDAVHAHPEVGADQEVADQEVGARDDAADPEGAALWATVRIAEDTAYYTQSRGVPSHVGIEYIAQTVGALVGLEARRAGGTVEVGYLLGTRRYRAAKPYFPLGDLLTIRVAAEFRSGGLARYLGEIVDATGERVVESSVTLYSGQLVGAGT